MQKLSSFCKAVRQWAKGYEVSHMVEATFLLWITLFYQNPKDIKIPDIGDNFKMLTNKHACFKSNWLIQKMQNLNQIF